MPLNSSPLISVVSPVYKAEAIVDLLVERLTYELSKITENFEIILVDDCGPDNSWAKIQKNSLMDKRVVGIKLSRNFGQHYAITAGLDHAKGEWVVVMDCDLQDRPEEIIKLYNKAQSGYDIVLARRYQRQDSILKKLSSKLFYKILSYLTGAKQDSTIANFGIYNRKVIEAVSNMRESIRVFPIMVRWVGFKSIAIDVVHAERAEGKSSYNFNKLFNLAIDIMLAYSDKPLRLTIKLGLLISFTAFLFTLYIVIRAISGGYTVLGYASIISSIWFLSGLIVFVLGVMGLYIGKIFQGVKNRPVYIIDSSLNLKAKNSIKESISSINFYEL